MTIRPVRVALQLQQQHADYPAIRDAVHEAEDLGADIVCNWDHFYPLYGPDDDKHLECWTMLGAWAQNYLGKSHKTLPSTVCVNRPANHGNGYFPAAYSPLPIPTPVPAH